MQPHVGPDLFIMKDRKVVSMRIIGNSYRMIQKIGDF